MISADKRHIRVDNSTLSTLQTCSTKAVIRYGLHRAVPGAMVAAKVGQAVHSALDSFFTDYDQDKAMNVLYEEYQKLALPGDIEKRLYCDNIQVVMMDWFASHGRERWPFEFDQMEMPVEVEFSKGGITYTGRIDALIRAKDSDTWYILDHKTTGNPSTWWAKQFELSSQLTGYIWAVQRMYPERYIAGAFINAVHLGEVPNSNRKCSTHGMKHEECGLLHLRHHLYGPYLRSRGEITNWLADVVLLGNKWRSLLDLVEGNPAVALQAVPQEGRWLYQGCSTCEFSEICKTGRKWDMIERDTIIEVWDPVKKDGA